MRRLLLVVAALQKEQDTGTRLSMHLSLLKLGQEGRFHSIHAAASSCKGEKLCDHAIMLLQWCGPKAGDFDQDKLLEIMNDEERNDFGHWFAAVILGDIALESGLKAATMRALLDASKPQGDGDDVSFRSKIAIALCKNLEADDTIRLLRARDVATDALIMRLSTFDEPPDLSLIRPYADAMRSRSGPAKQAVLSMLSRMEGKESEDLMVRIIERNRDIRTMAAAFFSSKRGVSKERLETLAVRYPGDALIRNNALRGLLALALALRAGFQEIEYESVGKSVKSGKHPEAQ